MLSDAAKFSGVGRPIRRKAHNRYDRHQRPLAAISGGRSASASRLPDPSRSIPLCRSSATFNRPLSTSSVEPTGRLTLPYSSQFDQGRRGALQGCAATAQEPAFVRNLRCRVRERTAFPEFPERVVGTIGRVVVSRGFGSGDRAACAAERDGAARVAAHRACRTVRVVQ